MLRSMQWQLFRLPASRVSEAYEVLQQVAEAIRVRGRRQRISQTSLETYQQWQADDTCFILTEDDRIIGLVTLCREVLTTWQDVVGTKPVPMIRALAVHPDHSGRGVGSFVLNHILTRIDPGEWVYLDCVSEFLPDYYAAHGFERLQRREHDDADGVRWDITLMRRRGTGAGDAARET